MVDFNRIFPSEFKSGHEPPDLMTLIGQEPRLDQKKLKNYKKWRKAYGNGVQCLVPSCFDVFLPDDKGRQCFSWKLTLFGESILFVLTSEKIPKIINSPKNVHSSKNTQVLDNKPFWVIFGQISEKRLKVTFTFCSMSFLAKWPKIQTLCILPGNAHLVVTKSPL